MYLSGSYANDEHIHGVSDIDYFIVIAKDDPDYRRELEVALGPLVRAFPPLGPLDERLDQIVPLEPDGRIRNPQMALGHELARLRPVFVEPGFQSEFDVPTPIALLAELRLQLKLVIERVRFDTDDAYFWRRRLHGLRRLNAYQAREDFTDSTLTAGRPPGDLVGRRDGREQHFELFLGILKGLHQSLSCDHRVEVTVKRHGEWPAEDSALSIGSRHQLLEAAELDWIELGGFRLRLCDQTRLFSPIDAPWAFTSDVRHEIGSLFWQWARRRAEHELTSLKERLQNGSEELLATDSRMARLPVDALRLASVGESEASVFLEERDAFDELAHRYPDHHELWGHLVATLEGRALGHSPPNLLGFTVEFAQALLGEGPLPEAGRLWKTLHLSLCIVTRDRTQWLEALLETVCGQERAPDQVVLVDNSPRASAREVVEEFLTRLPLHYVHQPNGRLGALRSRAIEEADGELICFTDDDCLLPPDWLAHAERSFLRDPKIGAVGGSVRHYPEFEGPIDRFHRLYLGA